MKLYSVSDGPPSLACRQALKALNIDYILVDVNYGKGEHMTDEYAKLNPQKEIPVLVDGETVMGESNAILQYLCDMYDKSGSLYPKDPKARAVVNHRLCFNLAMYYRNISEYVMAPIFFDYERTSLGLKKVNMSLDVFETYMKTLKSTYSAGDNLTIADFPLITATMCLEAIDFKLTPWPLVEKWYENFKIKHPDLWEIAADGLREIAAFEKNPPDLSHMDHPIHPVRKINK
ncbi:glutathione S-transferase 1-like [Leptopilina boulardi]|uniref:glutathione S-transferase 1-like n=1 Tax=Leptopilina boulardi TaxID=63433 RepID=UPI0021F5CB9B|nr:glutathione S-transferase 1-like [Leptopilina boulardi]XP_051156802.1 glutathione S-transferase 1-like [Leptopilina boulardi]XP_051156803.1 glutathione S-transferase 1-like [Leptopilina boulardi]